jgi:hypothetical protein
MPHDVFISFRLAEAEREANALKARLEAPPHSKRVFICNSNQEPGDNMGKAIAKALVDCKLAVLMASRTYGKATNDLFDVRLSLPRMILAASHTHPLTLVARMIRAQTGREMKFVLEQKKPFFLVRMIPFGEMWEEPETTLALPSSIMQALWLPGTPMPDELIDQVCRKLATTPPSAAESVASPPSLPETGTSSQPTAAPAGVVAHLGSVAAGGAPSPPRVAAPTGLSAETETATAHFMHIVLQPPPVITSLLPNAVACRRQARALKCALQENASELALARPVCLSNSDADAHALHEDLCEERCVRVLVWHALGVNVLAPPGTDVSVPTLVEQLPTDPAKRPQGACALGSRNHGHTRHTTYERRSLPRIAVLVVCMKYGALRTGAALHAALSVGGVAPPIILSVRANAHDPFAEVLLSAPQPSHSIADSASLAQPARSQTRSPLRRCGVAGLCRFPGPVPRPDLTGCACAPRGRA